MVLLGPGPLQRRGLRVDNITMNCSAAANESSSILFAFGSSHGVLNVDKTTMDLRWTSRITMPDVSVFLIIILDVSAVREPDGAGNMTRCPSHKRICLSSHGPFTASPLSGNAHL
jgi:hypothetical protein